MEKEKALEVAIEIAHTSIGAATSSVSTYPTSDFAEDVANFIETLTKRLTAM